MNLFKRSTPPKPTRFAARQKLIDQIRTVASEAASCGVDERDIAISLEDLAEHWRSQYAISAPIH